MIEIGARPHGDVTRGPSRGGAVSRIDLHLHSTASGLATTWWVRGLGLGQPVRESATAPGDAYALAKDAGMDFVALTDHETIAGGQALRDRPDFLLGEEICAIFPEDGSAVDILVYGLRPEHHAALQDLRGDVYRLVAALRELRLPCALAHPLFLPAGRLNRAMVEKRLLLFGLWETINGARPEPQNRLAARIAATADAVTLRQLAAAHGLPVPPHRRIAGIGGSDDHGGIAVGTTWTALPRVDTVEGVLEALRAGAVWADGEHGSVDKLVHAGCRIVAAGLAAGGEDSTLDGTPLGQFAGAIPLLGALPTASLRRLVEERQARQVVTALAQPGAVGGVLGVAATLKGVVDAHLALTPWLGVYGYFGREVGKTRELASALALPADRPLRVAVAVDALGATHGVTTFYRGVAAAPVAGIELTLVHADNRPEGVRLRAIGSLPIPLYGDGRLVVPSLLDALETIVAGEFDAVHVATPGPVGIAAFVAARTLGLPVVGAYHTEFGAYARHLSGDALLGDLVDALVRSCCNQCEAVVVPSRATATALAGRGYRGERLRVLRSGVDTDRFRPDRRDAALRAQLGGGRALLLYCGRLSREKGLDELADAYLALRARRDDVHLVLVGDGPLREDLRHRLGDAATFTGFLHGDALARVVASCDLFAFPSRTDTLGRAVTEAQASGLPAVVYAGGGPAECILPGVSGLAAEPEAAGDFAACIERLLDDPDLRTRMAVAAHAFAAATDWAAVAADLAAIYREVVGFDPADESRPVATEPVAAGVAAD